jgi:hypothetical protein
MVMPMGTSTSPVFLILPARAKTFVPLLFSVPMDANHSAPFLKNMADIGEGFHVVNGGRFSPQSLSEPETVDGFSAFPAFLRWKPEAPFLLHRQRPRPLFDGQVKGMIASENIFSRGNRVLPPG